MQIMTKKPSDNPKTDIEQMSKKFWEETAEVMQKYRAEGDERAAQGLVDARIIFNRLREETLTDKERVDKAYNENGNIRTNKVSY